MHANPSSLKMLHSVCHAALWFVILLGVRTHQFSLYEKDNLSSFYKCRMEHWYIFLYEAILHKLPPDLCSLLTPKPVSICMWTNNVLHSWNPYCLWWKCFATCAWDTVTPIFDYLITVEDYKNRRTFCLLNASVLLLNTGKITVWCNLLFVLFLSETLLNTHVLAWRPM